MIQIAPQIRILVAIEAIDGRKGIDAIAQLCREKLNADPFSGYLFIFRTRRGTAIRVLQYDGQGFWLATKRLSKGRFQWWPTGTEPVRTLRAHQAQLLLAAGNPDAEAPPAWRPVRPEENSTTKHLRSVFSSGTLTADGFRVEISRAGSYSRRCHFDSPVDRRESGRQPAQTFREALRGLAVETGQRRFARYGLPRLAAHAAPGRRDRITAHPLPNSQPFRPAGNSRTDADRHDADAGALKELRPIELQQVRRTADEPLFNSLMEQHHYLAYEQPVGEHLKYLAWAQGRPIACLAWSSAPRHLGSRDRYIGWSAEARRRNIRFIAYNTRFLILPWVRGSASGVAHSRGRWQRPCPTIGNGCTAIRFTSRKPSSIPDVFAEPVTARRTGNCSGSPPGAAKTTRPTSRTARSRKSSACP